MTKTEEFLQTPQNFVMADPMAMKHIDEWYEIQKFRKTARAKKLFAPFDDLPGNLEYIVNARFHHIKDSRRIGLPLSPRLNYFVEKAIKEGVGQEALSLACMLECDACSFSLESWMWENVQEINCRANDTMTEDGSWWQMEDFIGKFPLLCMSSILFKPRRFLKRFSKPHRWL